MKKQKKIIISFSLFFLFLFFSATVVGADEYGLDTAAKEAELPKVSSLPTYAGNIIGAGLSMVSIVFFVLMLYAGIRWMVARGNEEQETKAKDTIIAAVIGMVIIMASYALTNFVFKGSTGGQVPNKTPTTATQPQPIIPPKSGAVVEPKCNVKEGVTDTCQQSILKAYNLEIVKWNVAHQNDLDFVLKPGATNVADIPVDDFYKSECAKQEDKCEISPTIGTCVSLGGTYCSSQNIVNDENECNQVPDICVWQ